MATAVESRIPYTTAPVRALALGGTLAFFLAATLADVAYANTYEIQWQNFASWLIVGALVLGAVALLSAIVGLRPAVRHARSGPYAIVLSAAWIVGLLDAFMHARDAWASMPGGLVLSAAASVLTGIAAWLGLAAPRSGAVR